MDARMKRMLGAVMASVLLCIVALASGIVPIGTPDNSPGAGPISAEASNNFDQLVVVLFENHDITSIYGPATYMTQLANTYGISLHWQSTTNPSQPNYISLIGGSTFGVSGDGNHPNLNHPTIVDLIENSGHTWKAIAESAGGSGCGLSPPRGEDHFPFLSYTTITGNSARCANLISGDSNTVLAQLNAGVNFIWFTPTDNHNMHDNSVSSGDAWIAGWAPQLLSAMAGKKAALMVTFDEGYANPPLVYTSFSGPAAVLAHSSNAAYSHYSFIKLLEDVWGGGSLGQGDVHREPDREWRFHRHGRPDRRLGASRRDDDVCSRKHQRVSDVDVHNERDERRFLHRHDHRDKRKLGSHRHGRGHRHITGLRPVRQPRERLIRGRTVSLVHDFCPAERRFHRNGRADGRIDSRGCDDDLRSPEHQRESDLQLHVQRDERRILHGHDHGNERDTRPHKIDCGDRHGPGTHRPVHVLSVLSESQ